MKNLFHSAVVAVALLMLIISISGFMGNQQSASEEAEPDQMSLEAFNQIITEEQHTYQVEEGKEPKLGPPKFSTITSIVLNPRNHGHIVWDDPDGVEYETTYTVEGPIVRFGDDDKVRDVDRMRFKQRILGNVVGDETE